MPDSLWEIPPTHPTQSLLRKPLRRSDTNLTTPCDVSQSTQARVICNWLQSSQRFSEVYAGSRSAALPDSCPSSRTSGSFDKGQPAPANTPHLLRWCPATSQPRTQSAVTLYIGGVPVGGRGVNLPILFGHQFSHTIGSPHSRVIWLIEKGFRENPSEPHHTRAYGLSFFIL